MLNRVGVVLFLGLVGLSHSAFGQEYQKNGLPCVSEICLGDGLDELAKVKWDRAKSPFNIGGKVFYTSERKVSEADLRMLKNVYPGDVGGAAPYLAEKLFDGAALPALGKVAVACNPMELIGQYTTSSGNPTMVRIALIPDRADASKQRWTVTSIIRSFPGAVTNEQKNEVTNELKARYQAFDTMKHRGMVKPGEAMFNMNVYPQFAMVLMLFRGAQEGNQLKQNAACGGNAKVKVD